MNADEELAPSQRAFHAWWSVNMPSMPARATDVQLAEWVTLSSRFPRRTRVIVTPVLGAPWHGVVQGWTEPGSGRLMAIVWPDQGHGAQDAVHVLPRFLSTAGLAVQLAAQQE